MTPPVLFLNRNQSKVLHLEQERLTFVFLYMIKTSMTYCLISNEKLKERVDFLAPFLEVVRQADDKNCVLIDNLKEGIKYKVDELDWFIYSKERKKPNYKHFFTRDEIKQIKILVRKENRKGDVPKIGWTSKKVIQ